MRIKLPLKSLFSFGLVFGLIFIGFGDAFLPKPLSTISTKTRNQVNDWIIQTAGKQAQPRANKLKNSRYAKENIGSFFDRKLDEAEKHGQYDSQK